MKTLLYTGSDIAYDELAEITVPRMRSYALKHNMDFVHWIRPLIDVPNGIYWTGVCGALRAFEKGYERAIYLDVDQLVTNFDVVPVFDPPSGIWCSKDWGEDAVEPWHFSACGWIAHQDCVPMFEAVLDVEPKWRDRPFPEQGPWREWMREKMEGHVPKVGKDVARYWYGYITICSRRFFNAVPDQVCPGKVPEPWAPGDWCAHLTMLPLEDRVKLAKEILSKL